MIVTTAEIVSRFESKGEFQHFVDGLVRSAGRVVGISSNYIHSDYRINVGDFGIDIRVEKSHSMASETFLPQTKSIWSVKSGEAAFSVSKFHDEILQEGHEKVVEYLVDGYSYVWCSISAGRPEVRKTVEDSVAVLVTELAKRGKTVVSSQFTFRWNENVAAEAKNHPALLIEHFPELLSRFRVVDTMQEWKLLDPNPTDWVSFGDRNEVREEIRKHLTSIGEDNLYYLTGMSGIGKTRLVREACELFSTTEKIAVLYVRSQSRLMDESDIKGYLKRTEVKAVLVVDEVDPQTATELSRFFAADCSRLRIVCIGPSRKQEGRRQKFVRVLEGPRNAGEILQVLQQYEHLLPRSVLERVATSCRHDLRLALLLVDAHLNDERDSSNIRLEAGEILLRIVRSHHNSANDQRKLLDAFRVSSSFIDIGRQGNVAEESAAVSSFFNLNPTEFLEGLVLADKTNLGVAEGKYFEAGPAALATMVFEERAWPLIATRLNEFIARIPDRLLRKFLERCQECVDPIRSEVRTEVGSCFRHILGDVRVDGLQNENSARIFATWCEFDPTSGLSWLQAEIEGTDWEKLREFTGVGGFGEHWGGRRNIVWLCESLARFPMHFESCEIILWNLANNETEFGIGNNSIAIWKSLFWMLLSPQSIPFPERAKILLNRLSTDATDSSELLFSAVIEVLTPRFTGFVFPPDFVGGILAPEPWKPVSQIEMRDMMHEFGVSAIKIVGDNYSGKILNDFCLKVTKRFTPLLNLNIVCELRELCERIKDEDTKQKILSHVKDIVASIDSGTTQKLLASVESQMREWEQDWSPKNLYERTKYQTSRSYWDSVGDLTTGENPYVSLAKEIENNWECLQSLAEWFESEKAISTYNLGFAIGNHTNDADLDSFINQCILDSRLSVLCSGFLTGRSSRDNGLAKHWSDLLDSIVSTNSLFTIEVTANADITKRGFKRFQRAILAGAKPVSGCVSLLRRADWRSILSEGEFCILLDYLKSAIEANEIRAVAVALDFLWLWSENAKAFSQVVAKESLYFLQSAIGKANRRDFHSWTVIAERCCEFFPIEVSKIAIEWAASWKHHKETISSDDLNSVLTSAAKINPAAVMNEIGLWIKASDSYLLDLYVFRGLFDAIGVSIVSTWLSTNGVQYIRKIARHLKSPEIDEEGKVLIQPLTEWFFTAFETDEKAFQSFLAGRRSGAVWSSDEKAEDKKAEMEQFSGSHLRRLREWAKWEVRDAEWYEQISKEMDEDDQRR